MVEVEADSNSISNRAEQEEALVALIDHRSKEVDHLRKRLAYYQSQLEESEHRLNESLSKLARLRALPLPTTKKKQLKSENGHDNDSPPPPHPHPPPLPSKVKLEPNASPVPLSLSASASASAKPKLLIPSVSVSVTHPADSNKGTKRKLDLKHHQELIPLVRTSPTPCTFRCDSSNNISSQHKRKLRTIALSPLHDQLFVTSALDGVVNLWQVQSQGSAASLVTNTDCSSQQRRWPEDMAWHPDGNSVFCAYSADAKDSQISILHLDPTTQGRDRRVTFLEDKPHTKGIINNISFIPWEKTCFVTGGSDHGVILWDEKEDNVWKPKALHRNNHSSAVMGVAGMQQKNIVLSAGADKRIIGFDVNVGRADFKHQIDTKCMSVLPNPCDFNLFMVHAGTLEKQLRLFDIRLRQTEIHSFGWKQESSESQSALINQSWSPDGLYITSGSADPMIHIFDIRYNASKPSQSIRAHQKRVFKAVWLKSLRLLVSISSDLHIGLHKIT